MKRRQFPENEVIIREGEPGGHAWLIEDGQVEVFRQPANGDPVSVAVLGKNAIVGEMALIDGYVRSASARTLTPVSAVEIERDVFRQMMARSEPLTAYLLKTLVAEIRFGHGLPSGKPMKATSGIRTVRAPDKVVNRRVFEPGYVFFHQGDPGNFAYLIQSGEVSIQYKTAESTKELGPLGPGRIFGELALLTSEPRKATATAMTLTTCEIISQRAISDSIGSMPPILRALIRMYVRQIVSAVP